MDIPEDRKADAKGVARRTAARSVSERARGKRGSDRTNVRKDKKTKNLAAKRLAEAIELAGDRVFGRGGHLALTVKQ